MTPGAASPNPLAPMRFDRVLQGCRMEGFGGRFFGREDVRAAFGRTALDQGSGTSLATSGAAAWFAADASDALFAETLDGWIVRLWALGARSAGSPPPPSLSVPSDPDLDQRPDCFVVEAVDFPELATAHLGALRDAVLRLRTGALDPGLSWSRLRAVPILAFGGGGALAALFRLEGAREGGRVGCHAALLVDGESGETRLVVDHAGAAAAEAAPWQPVLRR